MRSDVARDLSDSAFEFQRLVWPKIRQWCGGGELVPVECVAAEGFIKQLDVLAGIDAWQVNQAEGIRGIASRVQWNDARPGFPYRTFTIRKLRFNGTDTEYAKRVRSLDAAGGWIYPYLTCQAFIEQPKRTGELAAVGVTRTAHLIDMISMGNCTTNQTHNASFWVVRWDELQRCGFDVKVWPAKYPEPREAAKPSQQELPTMADPEYAAQVYEYLRRSRGAFVK